MIQAVFGVDMTFSNSVTHHKGFASSCLVAKYDKAT